MLLEQLLLRLVAVHQPDGLHIDLCTVAIMDLHAWHQRATMAIVAVRELLGEESAASTENVPMHTHHDSNPFLAIQIQYHRQITRLRLPKPNADLVLPSLRVTGLLLPFIRRSLGRRRVLLVGSFPAPWLVGHGRRLLHGGRHGRGRRRDLALVLAVAMAVAVAAAMAVVVMRVLEALVQRRRRGAAPEALRRDGDRHGPDPGAGCALLGLDSSISGGQFRIWLPPEHGQASKILTIASPPQERAIQERTGGRPARAEGGGDRTLPAPAALASGWSSRAVLAAELLPEVRPVLQIRLVNSLRPAPPGRAAIHLLPLMCYV